MIHKYREDEADKPGLNFGWIRGPILTIRWGKSRVYLRFRLYDFKLISDYQSWTREDEVQQYKWMYGISDPPN